MANGRVFKKHKPHCKFYRLKREAGGVPAEQRGGRAGGSKDACDCAYWIAFMDAEGKRRRKKIGGTRTVAEEVLGDMLSKVARREFLGVIDESPISFKDVAQEYVDTLRPDLSPRTRERYEGIVTKHLKPYFAKRQLRSIAAADVEKYIEARRNPKPKPEDAEPKVEGRKPKKQKPASTSSLNHEVTILKSILKRAVAKQLLTRNPLIENGGGLVAAAMPLKEPKGRVRYASPEEIEALLAACEKVAGLRALVLILMNTGMRISEALSLSYGAIDRENRQVLVEQTKGGEPRFVFFNPITWQAIESLPRRLDGKLFGFKNRNQVSMAFRRATKRAKIQNFRLHDTRHTFASYQSMSGTHPRTLQSLLGHKDNRMTMRYSHLSDAHLRGAVNALSLGGAKPVAVTPPPAAPAEESAPEAQTSA